LEIAELINEPFWKVVVLADRLIEQNLLKKLENEKLEL
jgi:hypothetical protein